MKICIDPGHFRPPADTGAVAYLNEEKIARDVAVELNKILQLKGHKTLITQPKDGSTVTRSLSARCQQSNNFGADLFISIHCNAFKTTIKPMGSEVFATSPTGRQYASKIEQAIVGLGFKSRGVKDGSNFYVVKNTNCPAVLVELFFVDSLSDCDLYRKLGAVKLANAIASAI